MDTPANWDFFIAHASADTSAAEDLYDHLSGSSKVFLDSRSLELGDDWDKALSNAQKQALISVVLVSSKTDAAYYQREEIAAAIQMARENSENHRVIPIYLDEASTADQKIPYGLQLKQGLSLPKVGSLDGIAFQLLETLKRMKYRTVLYDSRDGAAAHFRGLANSYWEGKGANARRTSPIGEGSLMIEPGGILTITRTIMPGRFELHLFEHEWSGPNSKPRIFPANKQIQGDRKVWIQCQARTDGTKQGLRFILKNDETENWIANERRVVETKEWSTINVFFRFDPTQDFWFRIDHEDISQAPSQIQLRAIVLREGI